MSDGDFDLGAFRTKWARERANRQKRVCPLPVFAEKPKNACRWCNGEIVHGRAAQRSWHDGREDESDCLRDYFLHTRREVQFAHVRDRDGLKCWDCGGSPMHWRRGSETAHLVTGWPKGLPYPRSTSVEYVTSLELEHEIPLWSVAHLSDDDRRPYFGPLNLRLRCPDCHKVKTAREAGGRAKVKRNIRNEDPVARKAHQAKKRQIPVRPMGPSRGFPNTNLTRGFDGVVRPRVLKEQR